MSKCIFSLFTFFAVSSFVFADIGFDRIVVNGAGRCWKVISRDFSDATHWHSGVKFKVMGVGGTGQTDDIITYELTIKEDYYKGTGWDESKTKVFTGGGLVESTANGRVTFEIYVDLGDGNPPITVPGSYHPGMTVSDHDDNTSLNLPNEILNSIDPCEAAILSEGTDIPF